MHNFEVENKKLNNKQLEAVEYIEGPLLVVAGPGTGKTQLLSLRVANILRKTDSSPENIICLTFTNKAANEMRERLTRLAGPEGTRVPIRTFHGFAAELMAGYPEYFWNGASLTHVPDSLQLEIITEILSELPLDNPLALKFAGKFTSTKDVNEGLKLAKEAGLTPEKLRSLIEINQQYIDLVEPELVDLCSERLSYKKLEELADRIYALPDQKTDELTRPLISLFTVITESFVDARFKDEGTNKTANVSKWKARWINTVDGKKGMFKERKYNEWWLALADVYKTYRETLHQRGYYDYSDMIIEVISVLEQRPDMLADVQERFNYVLIDEFQDTNAAQLRLAHLVSDHHSANGSPNIMVVGDDDQAIYKFNGAELSNMLDFRRSYPAAKIIILQDNYRSSQAVLDFSDRLISQASQRLTSSDKEFQKILTALNEPEEKGRIEHLSYPTRAHQYHNLAKKIAFEHSKGSSVAVLARGHESLRQIAGQLLASNTPVIYEQQQSILEQEAVRQIMLIAEIIESLRIGATDTASQNLSELLRHPMWKIEPETLWQLAIKNRHNHDWITSLVEHNESKLQNIARWLLWLGQENTTQPLPRMLEYIIGLKASEHMTSPLREYFLVAPEKDKPVDTPYIASLSGVLKLIDLAHESCKQGHAAIGDLVRIIRVSEENNRPITDQSLFVSAQNAVELLTVHKAKGLEFDCVFVIDAQENIWKPNNYGRKPPANLPLRPIGDDLDDYIRLMFVAVTRAKKDVIISSYFSNDDGEAVLPCGIIRDILPAQKPDNTDTAETIEILEKALTWPRLEGSREKLLLKNIINNYELSATGLLNFLDVQSGGPQYFLERHLLKLPEAASAVPAFGSAIHSAMEHAQVLTCEDKFEIGEVLNAFERALYDQYLSKADHERYLNHGQQVLKKLFEEYNFELDRNGQPEVKLSEIRIGEAILQGKLDRADIKDKHLLITDYKTSSPLTNIYTKNKSYQIKAWRLRTQLQFYILLASGSFIFKDAKSLSAQSVYVESESIKHLSLQYTPTDEELERLRRLINAVWGRITTLNLPNVRHYENDYNGIIKFENDLLKDS